MFGLQLITPNKLLLIKSCCKLSFTYNGNGILKTETLIQLLSLWCVDYLFCLAQPMCGSPFRGITLHHRDSTNIPHVTHMD